MSKHIGADCYLFSSSKLAKQAAQGGSSHRARLHSSMLCNSLMMFWAPKQQSAEDSVSSTASCSRKLTGQISRRMPQKGGRVESFRMCLST